MAGPQDDFRLASRQFLRALRGKRSQIAFARRLGYRANPITDWEHGRSVPTATEALRACAVVGMDVDGAFRRFAPTVGESCFEPGLWLDRLRGSATIKALAERCGASRYSVGRWLSGASAPRLHQFFALVDAITDRLPDLVAELVDVGQVPVLVDRHRSARAARTLAFDEPWTEAVLRLIETDDYQALKKHEPGWLAGRLNVELRTEVRALSLLEAAGVVQKRRGRYRPVERVTVQTQADPEAMLALRRHWAQEGLRRVDEARRADYAGYNVISVSREDLDQVRERLRAAFNEIRSLVAASEPTEAAALVSMQLVSWDAD